MNPIKLRREIVKEYNLDPEAIAKKYPVMWGIITRLIDRLVNAEIKAADLEEKFGMLKIRVCPNCGNLGYVTDDQPNAYNCELGGTCPDKTQHDCRLCGRTVPCPECNVLSKDEEE